MCSVKKNVGRQVSPSSAATNIPHSFFVPPPNSRQHWLHLTPGGSQLKNVEGSAREADSAPNCLKYTRPCSSRWTVYALVVGTQNILLSEVKQGTGGQAGTSGRSSVVIVSNTSHRAKAFGGRVSGHPRGHARSPPFSLKHFDRCLLQLSFAENPGN